MPLRLRVIGPLLALALCAGAEAQKVNEFPKPGDPLHVRVDLFDKLTLGNHWNEGTIMQEVIFPPAGTEKPLVGGQEDVAGHTANYLAGYSHKYFVTKDEKDREVANGLMDGLLQLERVTGVPGYVARSFNQTDKPLWHEQEYFFPVEWHESKSMPGYRWEGDLSSDKFVDFIYGVATYYDYCADDAHKQVAADFIDRFIGRCVDNNFRLVDVDNKMTLWGNFCPDLPHEPLNALEMLAGLKTAYHMTGKERYRDAYRMLIEKHHYDDQAINAKVLWPREWTVPWDDELAVKSLYNLLRYEDDPTLLMKYRMSLNRHWYIWKDPTYKHSMNVWFRMFYQLFTGVPAVDEATVADIKNMGGVERKTREYRIPGPDGAVQTVTSQEENAATDTVHNYWFGVRYGFIDPAW